MVWSSAVLCDLTHCCLCLVRFDYCRFIELDYVPMETGYMVSMRPTKGYTSTKSPTKGYTSTKSPDRHNRSTNSPSTPRSRSVLSPSSFLPISVDSLKHGNDETLCTVVNVSWKTSERHFKRLVVLEAVVRLTVTNKLRPHRESLSLLSPTASLLVCAYAHLGIIVKFLNFSHSLRQLKHFFFSLY